jgi:hypothetical protein
VPAGSVKVKGLRELQRAFREMSKESAKELREGLREAAEPVRQEASRLFAPVNIGSAMGYRVRVRQRGVAVEQSRKRVTGQHPEYGALQMRTALIPALAHREDEVLRGVEKVLDELADDNGF